MCDLCVTGPAKEAAIKRYLNIALALENLSKAYEQMAQGKLDPHGPMPEVLANVDVIKEELNGWW